MKLSSLFGLLFFCQALLAQEPETIVDTTYSYRMVKPVAIPNVVCGNYVFRSEFDYIEFLNAEVMNPYLSPVFFTKNEMGLIIKKEGRFKVLSVIETYNHIEVNILSTPLVEDGKATYVLFLALQKSNKKIMVLETIQQKKTSVFLEGAYYLDSNPVKH